MSMRAPLDRVIITCAVTGNLTTPAQTGGKVAKVSEARAILDLSTQGREPGA